MNKKGDILFDLERNVTFFVWTHLNGFYVFSIQVKYPFSL